MTKRKRVKDVEDILLEAELKPCIIEVNENDFSDIKLKDNLTIHKIGKSGVESEPNRSVWKLVCVRYYSKPCTLFKILRRAVNFDYDMVVEEMQKCIRIYGFLCPMNKLDETEEIYHNFFGLAYFRSSTSKKSKHEYGVIYAICTIINIWDSGSDDDIAPIKDTYRTLRIPIN